MFIKFFFYVIQCNNDDDDVVFWNQKCGNAPAQLGKKNHFKNTDGGASGAVFYVVTSHIN